jgi:hypothetical protein
MSYALATAQADNGSSSRLTLVLISLAIAAAAAIAAMVPLALAASRGHRRGEALLGFTVLWAFCAAGSVIYATMVQTKWSAERDLRISSGYYDPREADADAPALPIGQWAVLGVAYVGLLAWAARRPARSPPPRRGFPLEADGERPPPP